MAPAHGNRNEWNRDSPYSDSKGGKGGGKKGGKGKNKSDHKKEEFKKSSKDRRNQGKNLKTPDGRLICLGFQQQAG